MYIIPHLRNIDRYKKKKKTHDSRSKRSPSVCKRAVNVFFFYSGVHSVQGSGATRCRELQSKIHSLCRYLGKIVVNPRLEKAKIVVFSKTASWGIGSTAIRGKKLLQWNVSQMEYSGYEGFATMGIAWRVLAVKVRIGVTNVVHLSTFHKIFY